jgi:hypothetical protein
VLVLNQSYFWDAYLQARGGDEGIGQRLETTLFTS